MEIGALQPEDGKFVIIESDVDVETRLELIGFDEESLDEELGCIDILEEAWGGVVIGGDLTIEGDTTSDRLPFELKDFKGFPVSEEGYEGQYFVIILGNLIVNGHLDVEQYRDLYVKGEVKVHSYSSGSGNFLSSGSLVARELIRTEPTDEGGILAANKMVAPLWVRDGMLDFAGYEDMDFENEIINTTDGREQALKALSSVLAREVSDDDFDDALDECLDAGKAEQLADAHKNAA